MHLTATRPFESIASALADLWLDFRSTESRARSEVQQLLAQAVPGTDAQRLQALSMAFESLRGAMQRWTDPACAHFAEEQLHAVRARGWPRALWLAEVAWAWACVYDSTERPRALDVLQQQRRQADADAASWARVPVQERAWRDVALCMLYTVAGDYQQALDSGLRAEAMVMESGNDLLIGMSGQVLSFLYLSVGDVEGALTVMPGALAAKSRWGGTGLGVSFNMLLALVLSRRFDEAAALLQQQPELTLPDNHAAVPALQALVARVRLAQGEPQAAAALPALRGRPDDREPHPVAANRWWVSADVLNASGLHDQARQLLAQGLQWFEESGFEPQPMNATQLYRALADACEGLGDWPAALAALRQSQAHCFAWAGDTMRTRLQTLHFGAADAACADVQRRQDMRLSAVAQSLTAAHAQTQFDAGAVGSNRLLAHVAHEVRNPIHGVVWMTSMLMMSDIDERQRNYLQLAQGSAHMALALCNDVLDLARLEAGRLALHPEPVDLAALVAECGAVYAPAAQEKGVQLLWHCDAALPARLRADPLRLRQVLMNLLSNATRFTQTGRIDVGLLWLGADAAPGQATVRLSVTDTGPGVPAELMPRLFQEFEKGAADPVTAAGGAGLGLALCRQFVHLMGGEMGVNNRLGQGCTFWCLLPFPPV